MEGHKPSCKRLPAIFFDDTCTSIDDSSTGVDGLGGEEGVEGLLLSADCALLGNNWEDPEFVLVSFGDEYRWDLLHWVAGEGDLLLLYLELITSLVLERRGVTALFFVAETKGGLGVSRVQCFRNACSDTSKLDHIDGIFHQTKPDLAALVIIKEHQLFRKKILFSAINLQQTNN